MRIRWDRWIPAGVLLFLAAGGLIRFTRKSTPAIPKITTASGDQIYYQREATSSDAQALADALARIGYFSGRGTSVMLSIHRAATEVYFVLDDGAWNHPQTIDAFEEIGRRVAPSVGGFPISVQLSDGKWIIHKSLKVGKVASESRDAVYYMGAATEQEGHALRDALASAGYLAGQGATVLLWRNDRTALGFVVADGIWNRPDAVATFDALGRHVAAAAGGLPLQVRLLDSQMNIRHTSTVQ